ncbi:MAG TPA: cysteine desulfurase family protein [Polyangia bacterium]|jgi:cysteine desulfurase|nr:cysteine desulfurase family protein [Polyangia bacterium]
MIYLDNAASTAPAPEVLEALLAAARTLYANPSSAHGLGAAAARAVEGARLQVAQALGAQDPGEIVFTSGGTEANALGILGPAGVSRGRHLVITALEHPAVLRTAEQLCASGYTLTIVPATPEGIVRVEDVVAAVRPETAVVAVMLVNNELGTVLPVVEIGRALKGAGATARGPHLHVDAVQAFGFLSIRATSLGADTVAISGHKFHGPKGTGALWVRPGVRLRPLWDGGRQERGLRSGTENVPGWVALGKAAALAVAHRERGAATKIEAQRDWLQAAVVARVPGARPTVSGARRAPHITSLAFPELPAEPLLHALEARGVYASAGAACASRTRGPSHVLKAVGLDDHTAVLRFSLSRATTDAEIEGAIAALIEAVAEIAPMAKRRAER